MTYQLPYDLSSTTNMAIWKFTYKIERKSPHMGNEGIVVSVTNNIQCTNCLTENRFCHRKKIN